MGDGCTPPELREGVRAGVLDGLQRDFELRAGRTARLLVVAGVIGVAGAVGVTLLVSGHPFGHHPHWHLAVFSAVWAGLLVVSLSIALLELRTPSLPLARAARVGIAGVFLAGLCGVACPDQHFLHWWAQTGVGGALEAVGGPALAALCFALVSTAAVATAAAALVPHGRPPLRPLLPALMLLVLLAPGIALQSIDTSWGVFSSWVAGTAISSYAGVASGLRLRARVAGS